MEVDMFTLNNAVIEGVSENESLNWYLKIKKDAGLRRAKKSKFWMKSKLKKERTATKHLR